MKYEYRNPETFPGAWFTVLREGKGMVRWRFRSMDGAPSGKSAGYVRKEWYLFVSSVSRTPSHGLRTRAIDLRWKIEVSGDWLLLSSKPRTPAERALAEARARPVEEGGGLGIPRLFERAKKVYTSQEALRRARSGKRET